MVGPLIINILHFAYSMLIYTHSNAVSINVITPDPKRASIKPLTSAVNHRYFLVGKNKQKTLLKSGIKSDH